jgi:ribonuclease BN (tRNA processing enzyme)
MKSAGFTLIVMLTLLCSACDSTRDPQSKATPSPTISQQRNAVPAVIHVQKGNPMVFTTLGTMSGPIASPSRSQPAYVLHNDQQNIVIDAGDGVAEQLAKVNVPLDRVQTIILTHLHIDHTGGLYALIGMRLQTKITCDLTIYGPYGTKKLVDGLVAGLQPLMDLINAAYKGQGQSPFNTMKVIEVTDGSKSTVGTVSVTAATNTHYNFTPGSEKAARYQSLSYRFDMPDRSIVFTGDTGPCANLEKLAHNVDLLVSEIMDVAEAMDKLKRQRPDLPFWVFPLVKKHFRNEHLTADEVGKLIQRSGAKSLVLTHNAGSIQSNERSRNMIASYFKGPITFAKDLENF